MPRRKINRNSLKVNQNACSTIEYEIEYVLYAFQGQLSRQGSSVESTTIVPLHHHTAECAGVGGRSLHQPTEHSKVVLKYVLSHQNLTVHVRPLYWVHQNGLYVVWYKGMLCSCSVSTAY